MKQIKTNYNNLKVDAQYDVVVCGGGPAGFIAAVSAARNGASTALVERYGFLGGMATAAFVTPISEFKKNGVRVIDGIPWEFIEKLADNNGAITDYPNGNVPFDPEIYKLVSQRMVLDAGVALYLHSWLSACNCENGRISSVIIENKSGTMAIGGNYFIDATGDADLAAMAGVAIQPFPKEFQPATLCFKLGGVDTEHLENIHLRDENKRYSNKRVRDIFESLSKTERVPNFGGPWFCTALHDGMVIVNMTRTACDATDERSLTVAECQLREDVYRFVEILRKHVPEFHDCYLLGTGAQIGTRESRRIHGLHLLTGEEFLACERFEDSIARGAHPVDIHRTNDTKQDVHFLTDASFIPYRSLVAEGFPNFLAAGRCISADGHASASIRVQAPCMAIGQAAGTAAALCNQTGCDVQDISIAKLQEKLHKQKAVF